MKARSQPGPKTSPARQAAVFVALRDFRETLYWLTQTRVQLALKRLCRSELERLGTRLNRQGKPRLPSTRDAARQIERLARLPEEGWRCVSVKVVAGRLRIARDRRTAATLGLTGLKDEALKQRLWLLCEVGAVARFAKMTLDPAVMKLVDIKGLNQAFWAAAVVLASNRARRLGELANAQKRRNFPERDAQSLRDFERVRTDGLKAMKSEKAARADAIRHVAKNRNVEPQRARDIIRKARE